MTTITLVVFLILGPEALAINSVTAVQPSTEAALAQEGYEQPSKPSATYKVALTVGGLNDASTGTIVIEVHPEWAPLGAQRFKKLIKAQFFDNTKFFRVVTGFMAQFGLAPDGDMNKNWRVIQDDPDMEIKNSRGRVTFATAGVNTRATQVFINTVDNLYLDKQGYTPFGEVIKGMEVVDKLYAGYGEGAPLGQGPSQSTIEREGNVYLDASFPNLSTIQTARLVAPPGFLGRHSRAITILFRLAGLSCLLAIGTSTAYRTGALDKLRAKIRASGMLPAASVHDP